MLFRHGGIKKCIASLVCCDGYTARFHNMHIVIGNGCNVSIAAGIGNVDIGIIAGGANWEISIAIGYCFGRG